MSMGGDETSTSNSSNDNDGQGPAKRYMFSGRSIQYLIEEGIRCLMDLEDVDSMLAALPQPPQASHPQTPVTEDPLRAYERARLLAQRQQLVERLVEAVDMEETQEADIMSNHNMHNSTKS